MEIPILIDHDHHKPVGFMREIDGKMYVEFAQDGKITKELAFEIFGNVGLRILDIDEADGKYYIRKAEIVEFSLAPHHVVVPNKEGEPRPTNKT